MYKVAESTSYTAFPTVEPTTCFSKICDRTELAIDRSCSVPPRIQGVTCLLRIFLVLESCIDIANEMVIIIVAHYHFFDLSVFAHLTPEILVEGIEMILQL